MIDDFKESMQRKVYRLLDYVANIINVWDLKGDFVSYLWYKINKEE